MKKFSVSSIISVMKRKYYPVFETGDYNINTVGIRSIMNDETGEVQADRFNDCLCVFYKVKGKWKLYTYKAATVPGIYYLQHPMLPEFGTAILAPGFYRGAYTLGLHYGLPALQQVGLLRLYRDTTRDMVLDLDGRTVQ
ncbi:MAG: hypothetical protein EPN93_02980 [Spirochaetes bacterium]|nr:MAG: hypothetical protein EPN93_02980 [Spirochaetota bacterium]